MVEEGAALMCRHSQPETDQHNHPADRPWFTLSVSHQKGE